MIYYLLSFLSGIFITLQVAINGQLRQKVGSPILSSFISFFIGSLCLGLIFCFTLANKSSALPSLSSLRSIRPWMLLGGVLGSFYIFTTLFASPKIGFASMFCLVICGQVILSTMIDHFGLFGNEIHHITPSRIVGVILLISGVFLIQKH